MRSFQRVGAIWIAVACGVSVAGRPVESPKPAVPQCRLGPVAAGEFEGLIAAGEAATALGRAQAELTSHPDCLTATRLRSAALVALGRSAEAAELLLGWADRDPMDLRRIETLIHFYRMTGDLRQTPDLIARIDALTEAARTVGFRALLDALHAAQERKLSHDVVAHMFDGGPVRAPGESCALDAAAYLGLERWIDDGAPEAALGRARDELASHPSCWFANRAQAGALVALGKPEVALGLLMDWADGDRNDPARVEALIEVCRQTDAWHLTADLTARIDGLPGAARARMLRMLLDDLYEAGETELAGELIGRLVPGATEDEIASLRRALGSATRRDMDGVREALSTLPSAEASPALRAEALIVVSQRAASACLRLSCACPATAASEAPPTVPRRISQVEPTYPDRLRRTRAEGSVMLTLALLPSGEPVVCAVSGGADRLIARSAAEAVAQWRYEPGRIGGEPVTVNTTVRVEFRLH